MSEIITWEEVETLRAAIPPRQPQGDLRNRRRIAPVRRFNWALKAYLVEHGHTWFEDKPK